MKRTMTRVNGIGKVNGKVPRSVIERNVLDMLERNEAYLNLSFCEAQVITEEATVAELLAIYDGTMTEYEFKAVYDRIMM